MGGGGDGVMMECGMWCGCGGGECGRRVTRRGVAVRVRVEWDRRKGWGLVAGEGVRAGQYVCEYAGIFKINQLRKDIALACLSPLALSPKDVASLKLPHLTRSKAPPSRLRRSPLSLASVAFDNNALDFLDTFKTRLWKASTWFYWSGELLTTEETRKRQQKYDELASSGRFSSALLVVREHLPSRKACFRINIDATKIGNVARFINHSCDGGSLSTVLVHNSGSLLPRVCFFASKDIKEGEELSFSYGDARLNPEFSVLNKDDHLDSRVKADGIVGVELDWKANPRSILDTICLDMTDFKIGGEKIRGQYGARTCMKQGNGEAY
ncbi:Histone-lysine N-methyltransferase SUVR3-like protein [Drosera capensis]